MSVKTGFPMPDDKKSPLELVLQTVQVLGVAAGVAVSVWQVGLTTRKDADARSRENTQRQAEAAKPFVELRQQRYTETLEVLKTLADEERHTKEELGQATKRFWELYWVDLSLVESKEVESAMKEMGDAIKNNAPADKKQILAYQVSHAIRDSLRKSWGIRDNEDFNP